MNAPARPEAFRAIEESCQADARAILRERFDISDRIVNGDKYAYAMRLQIEVQIRNEWKPA